MIDLRKLGEFFEDDEEQVHVIGVGAMGSRIVEQLARVGITNIYIYDFDTVAPENVSNQLYTNEDIGILKTTALKAYIDKINNEAIKFVFNKGYEGQRLKGHVFLCVDSIETRKEIVKQHMNNPLIKSMYDARMRLTDAQAYGADWSNPKHKEAFYSSMDFTSEEAIEATPVSACGTTLSVSPTVAATAALAVSNFMSFIKNKELKQVILLDAFLYNLNAF